jgi:hypothetical protein
MTQVRMTPTSLALAFSGLLALGLTLLGIPLPTNYQLARCVFCPYIPPSVFFFNGVFDFLLWFAIASGISEFVLVPLLLKAVLHPK